APGGPFACPGIRRAGATAGPSASARWASRTEATACSAAATACRASSALARASAMPRARPSWNPRRSASAAMATRRSSAVAASLVTYAGCSSSSNSKTSANQLVLLAAAARDHELARVVQAAHDGDDLRLGLLDDLAPLRRHVL